MLGCIGAGVYVSFFVFTDYLIHWLMTATNPFMFGVRGAVLIILMIYLGAAIFIFCRRQQLYVQVPENMCKVLGVKMPATAAGTSPCAGKDKK